MNDLFFKSGAVFSFCRTWRYTLTRRWSDRAALNVIALNPSVADETANDPTITRLIRRAQRLDFGGLVVTNIFALRSTDPRGLRNVDDPVGPKNDHFILAEARAAGMVLCAWGQHGSYQGRAKDVLAILNGIPLYALRLSQNGSPVHPLYLPYDLEPRPWAVLESERRPAGSVGEFMSDVQRREE